MQHLIENVNEVKIQGKEQNLEQNSRKKMTLQSLHTYMLSPCTHLSPRVSDVVESSLSESKSESKSESSPSRVLTVLESLW